MRLGLAKEPEAGVELDGEGEKSKCKMQSAECKMRGLRNQRSVRRSAAPGRSLEPERPARLYANRLLSRLEAHHGRV
jgi:hypothetical protein